MLRDIVRMGDERLLKVADPVPDEMIGSPELKRLVADMFETMRDAKGVGLAAPQIGENLQLMVFGFDANPRYPGRAPVAPRALLNPIVTPLDNVREAGWEGCLSIPGLRGQVERYKRIHYQGIDPDGQPIDESAEDFHARIVQHEFDHLIGRLYPSRITDFRSFGFTDVLFPEGL
ncbi:Peptide deformylase [Carnimonas sp. R-84981]|uniref:peptide deformylase n=1 Tax=Carnimonas bestiolae TaxID=3402172 RepID=UPI003EDC3D41